VAITSNSSGLSRNLLEKDVGNGIFDEDHAGWRIAVALFPTDNLIAVGVSCKLVSPFSECPFGKFLNVPFVDEGHALAAFGQSIVNRCLDQLRLPVC